MNAEKRAGQQIFVHDYDKDMRKEFNRELVRGFRCAFYFGILSLGALIGWWQQGDARYKKEQALRTPYVERGGPEQPVSLTSK